MAPNTSETWQDVRQAGFAARVELGVARSRLAAVLPQATAERVPLAQALGRTTATAALAPRDLPPLPRARVNGYALTATTTFGASSYNPLELITGVSRIAAGEPMPLTADAVLPFSAASMTRGILEAAEPVAPGDGVEPTGAAWRRGTVIIPAGRRLSALDLARGAEAGLAEIDVFHSPLVRILSPGSKGDAPPVDPLTLLLGALVERDGALPKFIAAMEGIAAAMRDPAPADLLLVAGRSGCGADDDAAPSLAALGRVDVHGLAIAPGGSAGLGRIGSLPLVLLPGEPLACLAAYELLVGPALRPMVGRDPALPYRRQRLPLGVKIASQVGTTELWLASSATEGVVPFTSPERATLATTVDALGFILVPAESEGHPAGAEVEVHLFDSQNG